MITFYGQPASLGLGKGVLIHKQKMLGDISLKGGVEEELKLFEEACILADAQYEEMVTEAKESFGTVVAMMVWTHQLLIQDVGLRNKIRELIKSGGVSADYAIMKIATKYIDSMSEIADDYLRERKQDLLYVVEWLVSCCSSIRNQKSNYEVIEFKQNNAVILIGKNFALEDVIAAKKRKYAGMIDLEGSIDSHSVMVAKELQMPMLIKLKEDIVRYVNQLARLNTDVGCIEIE